jgi:hypothetical protein
VIRAPKDFGTGLLFLAIGLAEVAIASHYPLGSAQRMGPGYFPMALGGLLAGLGFACLARSFVRDGEPISGVAWKPLVSVTLAIVAFGLLVRGAGLVVALLVLVLGSASASRYFTWRAGLALAAGLIVFSVLVFVRALGLPMPVLGSWLGG